MSRTTVTTPRAPAAIGPYSQAILTDDTLYCSGQIAIDPDTGRDVIEKSRAVAIGTPTFNGDAVKPVWDFVSLFSTVYSIGKKAAVFGSYGWGGEGIKLVAERLAGMKLKVHDNQFRTRLVPSDTENQETRAFATGLAEFVGPAK